MFVFSRSIYCNAAATVRGKVGSMNCLVAILALSGAASLASSASDNFGRSLASYDMGTYGPATYGSGTYGSGTYGSGTYGSGTYMPYECAFHFHFTFISLSFHCHFTFILDFSWPHKLLWWPMLRSRECCTRQHSVVRRNRLSGTWFSYRTRIMFHSQRILILACVYSWCLAATWFFWGDWVSLTLLCCVVNATWNSIAVTRKVGQNLDCALRKPNHCLKKTDEHLLTAVS